MMQSFSKSRFVEQKKAGIIESIESTTTLGNCRMEL